MKKKKDNKNEIENDSSYWLPIGMCLGISVGMSIGLLNDNIPLWMSVGLSIGLCLGAALSLSTKKK